MQEWEFSAPEGPPLYAAAPVVVSLRKLLATYGLIVIPDGVGYIGFHFYCTLKLNLKNIILTTQPLMTWNRCLSIGDFPAVFREGRCSLVFCVVELCLSPRTDRKAIAWQSGAGGSQISGIIIRNNKRDDEIHCGWENNSSFLWIISLSYLCSSYVRCCYDSYFWSWEAYAITLLDLPSHQASKDHQPWSLWF